MEQITNGENAVAFDKDEFDAAKKEAAEAENPQEFIHKFASPISYNGKQFKQLQFKFGNLTGKDGLAIENEIQAMGKIVITPAFSVDYLVRMAARACTDKIGIDIFDTMSLFDFNKIRGAARSFLLM
jgi:hypothetical protein